MMTPKGRQHWGCRSWTDSLDERFDGRVLASVALMPALSGHTITCLISREWPKPIWANPFLANLVCVILRPRKLGIRRVGGPTFRTRQTENSNRAKNTTKIQRETLQEREEIMNIVVEEGKKSEILGGPVEEGGLAEGALGESGLARGVRGRAVRSWPNTEIGPKH